MSVHPENTLTKFFAEKKQKTFYEATLSKLEKKAKNFDKVRLK